MADFASGFAQGASAVNDVINTYYRSQYYKEHTAELERKRKQREDFARAYNAARNGRPPAIGGSAPAGAPPAGPQAATPGVAPTAAPTAPTPGVAPADAAGMGMEEDDPLAAVYAHGGQVRRQPAINPQMARNMVDRFTQQPAAQPGVQPGAQPAAPAEVPVSPMPTAGGEIGAGAGEVGASAGQAGAAVGEGAGAVGEGVGAAAAGAGEGVGAAAGTAGAAVGEGVGAAAGAAGAAAGEGVGAAAGAAGAAIGEGAAAGGAAIGEGVAALGAAIGEAIPAVIALAALAEGGRVPRPEEVGATTIPGEQRPAIDDGAPQESSLPDAREGGVAGAIRGFYDFVGRQLGGRPGAVDTPDAQGQRQALAQAIQSASPADAEAQVRRAGGVPDGQPIPTLAWNTTNNLLTHHFLSHGDIEGLQKAQVYLESARSNGAARAASMAIAAGQSGDTAGMARALGRLNDFMPDGNDYSFQATANGIQVTRRPENGGEPETRVLSPQQALDYANNLIDPEKQRQYLFHVRQQEEVERNGASTRESQAQARTLALRADGRAAATHAATMSDRALEREHSAAVEALARLPESATAEQRQAAEARVSALRSRMVTSQRTGAINADTAQLNQTELTEQRAAGRAFTSSMTAAQQAAQAAEDLPVGDPRRSAADEAAATAQAAAVRAFGQLNLQQAGQATTLMQRLETMGMARQDRQQVGTYVDSLAQVSEAQGALRQAQATRDPGQIQAAQTRLTEALATNRRALTGMSDRAVAKLGQLGMAQERLGNQPQGGRSGSGGAGGVTGMNDRKTVEEAVEQVVGAIPADRRSRMSPADTAAVRDVAVDLGDNNRLAPRQAAEAALALHSGEVRVDPNSLVVTLPSGTQVTLSASQHAALLARQSRPATAEPERGSASRVIEATRLLPTGDATPRGERQARRAIDERALEQRRAAVRQRVEGDRERARESNRRAAIEGPR